MTQESNNTRTTPKQQFTVTNNTGASPTPNQQQLDDINSVHPILATVYFVIMLIYMMILICKYSFSWRCRLIMVSFVIVNAFKLIPVIIVYQSFEQPNITISEIESFMTWLTVGYVLDHYVLLKFAYVVMKMVEADIEHKTTSELEIKQKNKIVQRNFKRFIYTYLPLYTIVVAIRLYFQYVHQLKWSTLTFDRVLIVFYYIVCLVIAILDTLVMIKATKMCQVFWMQCKEEPITLTKKHKCIIFGMKIVSYLLFSGSVMKDLVFPLNHVQIMINDNLVDQNIFFKGNSQLITFFEWTFIIAITNQYLLAFAVCYVFNYFGAQAAKEKSFQNRQKLIEGCQGQNKPLEKIDEDPENSYKVGTTETERDFFVDQNVNFGKDYQPNDELKRSLIDALGPQPVNSSYLLRDTEKTISGLGGDLSIIDDTEFKYDENEEHKIHNQQNSPDFNQLPMEEQKDTHIFKKPKWYSSLEQMFNPAIVRMDSIKLPTKSPIQTGSNGEDDSITPAQIERFNQQQGQSITGLSFHKRFFNYRKRLQSSNPHITDKQKLEKGKKRYHPYSLSSKDKFKASKSLSSIARGFILQN